MQKGNHDDQQQHIPTSEDIPEYSVTDFWFHESPSTSIVDSNDATNFTDIVKVLSQVELPSPSPIVATSCSSTRRDNMISFHQGQLSSTKNVNEMEENVEWDKELKDEHETLQEPQTQFVAPRAHSTEPRRRSRIHERIGALKELVPNCNKRDQASILDDAIKYIKSLQMQVQMMQCVGSTQSLYMPPERNLSMQLPYLAPCLTRRPMIGPEYGAQHYGTYFTTSPIFPPFVSGLNPLVPPMDVGTGSPRLLPIPHLQFPSNTPVPVYSTTLSSDNLITTTESQLGSGIYSQSSYHMPMTSQEMQQLPCARVRGNPRNHLTMGTRMPNNDSNDE